MKRLFLIIGAPGSGKTTDAQRIAQKYPERVVHYSTGELLRAQVERGTKLGETIASYVDRGALVPLEIVMDTIEEAIKESDKEIVLIDGFPRSVQQMEALDRMLQANPQIALEKVVEIVVSPKTAKERVLGRGRGADDNEEVFHNRMQVYLEPLPQIEAFYQERGHLAKVDGERSIEEIVQDIEKLIFHQQQ
ncbi:MAG: adenylate kinase [Nitratiruptor sp.]|nr:adenylate kinase [Nitratiruptor sp.]NPA84159.1 adenylate kinase [Campylobacterota bacterium]